MTCSAFYCHGPGHQSKSHCELPDGHDGSHETHLPDDRRARWNTGDYIGCLRATGFKFNPASYPEDIGMSGYFDEVEDV